MAWAKKESKQAPKMWECKCAAPGGGKIAVPAVIAFCKRCGASRPK